MSCKNANVSGSITSDNVNITGGEITISGGDETSSRFRISSDNNDGQVSIYPYGMTIQGQNSKNVVFKLLYNFNIQNGGVIMDSQSQGGSINVGNGNISNFFYADGINEIVGAWGPMYANSFNNNSKEDIKKNIEKFDINVIELLKNSEIYTFNYKTEKNTDKKHIGFIIGDKYKTPTEVISNNKESIDTYSMASILWKAIQEQQEIIESSNIKINKLEEIIKILNSKINKLEEK